MSMGALDGIGNLPLPGRADEPALVFCGGLPPVPLTPMWVLPLLIFIVQAFRKVSCDCPAICEIC